MAAPSEDLVLCNHQLLSAKNKVHCVKDTCELIPIFSVKVIFNKTQIQTVYLVYYRPIHILSYPLHAYNYFGNLLEVLVPSLVSAYASSHPCSQSKEYQPLTTASFQSRNHLYCSIELPLQSLMFLHEFRDMLLPQSTTLQISQFTRNSTKYFILLSCTKSVSKATPPSAH